MKNAAAAQLQKQFRSSSSDLLEMKEDPVEGVFVELINDNLFEWKTYIEGPKDTAYAGGIYQALLSFPEDFPMMPPKFQLLSEFWHPNVYNDGKVCISILHPPGDDPMSGETAAERWLPTQSVQSIMLSVISMLADPNTSSPANVDASVEWRKDREAFETRVKKLAEKAKKACPSHVKIPHPDTDPEERARFLKKMKMLNEEDTTWMDEVDDDDMDDMDDDDGESEFIDDDDDLEDDEEPVDDE